MDFMSNENPILRPFSKLKCNLLINNDENEYPITLTA